ncbi:response regulator [Desulforhopalus sp. IMCC35007]|uniref:hybrid sensor histidine kinase/response regulator n=1 Tax=Desulforhopalus sp. IMCC35007 TaxID=2569543 RepID=UPI0010ADE427|nr:response regulator [Desulforhopalus sp. IMCC35007]TKB07640.1 response regulator [Desulforhopalus sp. IMCC35007]
MPHTIQLLKDEIEKKDVEIAYYRRILNQVSNRTLRELEEVSKVAGLLKEKEQIQEKLQRAKRMESIGLMAGGVAHDLNNILSGIINYPELILLHLPEESPIRSQVLRIKKSGLRAASVVEDLLTVARGVACSKEVHDLNEIVFEYTRSPQYEALMSRHPHITCEKKIDNPPLPICCSPVHVTKCIMNLVANAAEAIQGRGNITISTFSKNIECGPDERVNGKFAILQVSDNGHGMSKESLNQIFEPFYTKKIMGRSGTGLGLSVVWNTMEDHQGYVDVTSGEHGSCFSLYFPLSKIDIKTPASFLTNSRLRGEGNILVVDDDEVQRDVAVEILTHLGYRASTVSSGEEAITYLRSNSIDLVLLDMVLGKGMNGYETYKKISAMNSNQKTLIVSGFSENQFVEKACRKGAGGFIKKPYTIDQLGSAVMMILSK